MNKQVKKLFFVVVVLIKTVSVDANIPSYESIDYLISTNHESFPGSEVISHEVCPIEERISSILHCESTDTVPSSLLFIQEVEGNVGAFDEYMALTETNAL